MQSTLKYRTETRLTSIEYMKLRKYCKQHHTTHSKLIRNFLDNLTNDTVIKPNHNHLIKIKKLQNKYKIDNHEFHHIALTRTSLDNIARNIHDGVLQIARIGNNLNQIVKQVNQGNTNAVTVKALDKVRKVVAGAAVMYMNTENMYKNLEKKTK